MKRTSVDIHESMGFILLYSIPYGGKDCQAVTKRSSPYKPESRLFRLVSGVGVAKSLGHFIHGPVVLIHTKEVRPQSRKPNCTWHPNTNCAVAHAKLLYTTRQLIGKANLCRFPNLRSYELVRDLRCPLLAEMDIIFRLSHFGW